MTKIRVIQADITQLPVQCIVNASNPSGLGCNIPNHCVDSAIHLAAGPELYHACTQLGGIPTGVAKITPAFRLPSKYVIHCTGPRTDPRNNNREDHKMLSQCYYNILSLATRNRIREIAFCCISTGLYGFSKTRAALTALQTVKNYTTNNPHTFDTIIFCTYDRENTLIYKQKILSI